MDPSVIVVERELFLENALQKAVGIVETVEECYREAAFPIIFEYLVRRDAISSVDSSFPNSGNSSPNSQKKLSSNLSVNEFFQKAKPHTQIDEVVCIAYYLFHVGNVEEFSYTEVREIFGRKLRRKEPKNLTDVVNKCIKSAYIIETSTSTNGQRRLVITQMGEQYVESLLEGGTDGKR